MTNGLFTSNKTVLIFSKTMVSTFYLFINNINARTKMFYKKCQFFILLPLITQICQVKFIYSEKATKFYEIFPLLLTVCTVVKSKAKISQNFVVFSEYMNFTSFEMGLLVEIGYCSCESFIQKEKVVTNFDQFGERVTDCIPFVYENDFNLSAQSNYVRAATRTACLSSPRYVRDLQQRGYQT